MTNTQHHGAALGVFSIISEAFGLLFKKIVPIGIICIAITSVSFFTGQMSGNTLNFGFSFSLNNMSDVFAAVVGLVFFSVQAAILTGIAYDSKLGRRTQFMPLIKTGIGIVPALLVILIFISLAVVFPILSVVLPIILFVPIGAVFQSAFVMVLFAICSLLMLLLVAATCSVVVPALVIERTGIRSIGRSFELTQGYRPPIIGALSLIYLFIFIVVLLLGVGVSQSLIMSDFLSTPAALRTGLTIVALITGFVSTVLNSLVGLALALIYARLREIKEGVGLNDLSKVFE